MAIKPPPDRLYGRTRTHALRPRQETLLQVTLPRLRFDPAISLAANFTSPITETWLEIGFGGGEHARAVLVGRDEVLEFPLIHEAPAILSNLLGLYWQGLRQPLKFFPQTSLAYAEASQNQTSGKTKDPMSAALTSFEGNSFTKMPGEGEDAYYDLCFRNTDPLDQEFERIALEVFGPQLNALKEVVV